MATFIWWMQIEPDGRQFVHFECSACRVHIRFSNQVGIPVAFCCGQKRVMTRPRKNLLRRYANF
jgi:hypothetical protein